jgi:glycosyltransferase involved in cell wall biosynthesis
VALLASVAWGSEKLSSSSLFSKKRIEDPVAVLEHKPFVIVVPSYNNSEWVEKNLRSLFEQKYDNYRVIYIDDASTDSTLEQVEMLISALPQGHRVTLVHNHENRGAVENIYRAVHSCEDHEIVLLCDGDDWLAHDRVLEQLNHVYSDPSVWLTFGSYIEYPSYGYTVANFSHEIPQQVIRNNKIRSYSKKHWAMSHLRGFYASLFKKIRLEDLMEDGRYYDAAYDLAFMIPMAEMGGEHIRFLPEISYIYNRANALNDNKVRAKRQQAVASRILSLSSYELLQELRETRNESVDLLVFSYDRPMQLYAFLESAERYAPSYQNLTVIYRVSDARYEEAYQQVNQRFPKTRFIRQSQSPSSDFKPLVMKVLNESNASHVAFAVDDIILTDEIDLVADAHALRDTGAYGLYYRLGTHVDYCYAMDVEQGIPPLSQVDDHLFAWSFKTGKGDWAYPNSLDFTLYDKSEVLAHIASCEFIHPNSLEAEWAKKAKLKRIGLCHASSKMVNIPLNLVNLSSNRSMNSFTPVELLEKFNQGLKIDIAPLYQIKNHSAHIDYTPQFALREENSL